MAKSPLLKPKAAKKPLTVRLSSDVRKQAENIAKANEVSLTQVVEAGLILLFEKIKAESSTDFVNGPI